MRLFSIARSFLDCGRAVPTFSSSAASGLVRGGIRSMIRCCRIGEWRDSCLRLSPVVPGWLWLSSQTPSYRELLMPSVSIRSATAGATIPGRGGTRAVFAGQLRRRRRQVMTTSTRASDRRPPNYRPQPAVTGAIWIRSASQHQACLAAQRLLPARCEPGEWIILLRGGQRLLEVRADE
jgi:hypothetical protein